MYVGTYTNGSDSKGVYVYDFDEKSSNATLVKTIPMSNPSFLSRKGNILYAVNEDTKGMLTVFDLKNDIVLNQVSTQGVHPCHISLSPKDPIAVVSNYSSGSLILYSLNSNGSIHAVDDFMEFKGSSINRDRQNNSHIHSAFFSKDGAQVFVSDLGADLIYVFSIINTNGKYGLHKVGEIKTKLGGGPRHLTFSKDEKTLYSVLEMTGEIEVFQWTREGWISKQIVPIYPADFEGQHGGADIKIDKKGKNIYATNRGTANILYKYKILRDGRLMNPIYRSVNGDSPRNLSISLNERFILISNQTTNNIVIFNYSLKLSKQGYKSIEIPKPVCVIF